MNKKKNVTIEATLIDYKVVKHHDITATILKLKGENYLITGLFVDDYYNLIKDNKYKIRGNIIPIKNIDIDDFNKIIDGDIKKFINDDRLFCITAIEPIKSKPLIASIELSLWHDNINDLVKLKIPISAIEILEINKISTSIEYLKDGRYDNITTCDNLVLRLLIDKLSEKTAKVLLDNICLFSITLLFDNGDEKYYNLPYHSKDDERNDLQRIDNKNNKIIILVDEELKYGKFEK